MKESFLSKALYIFKISTYLSSIKCPGFVWEATPVNSRPRNKRTLFTFPTWPRNKRVHYLSLFLQDFATNVNYLSLLLHDLATNVHYLSLFLHDLATNGHYLSLFLHDLATNVHYLSLFLHDFATNVRYLVLFLYTIHFTFSTPYALLTLPFAFPTLHFIFFTLPHALPHAFCTFLTPLAPHTKHYSELRKMVSFHGFHMWY